MILAGGDFLGIAEKLVAVDLSELWEWQPNQCLGVGLYSCETSY